MELIDIKICPDPLRIVLDHTVQDVVQAYEEAEGFHSRPELARIVGNDACVQLDIRPVREHGPRPCRIGFHALRQFVGDRLRLALKVRLQIVQDGSCRRIECDVLSLLSSKIDVLQVFPVDILRTAPDDAFRVRRELPPGAYDDLEDLREVVRLHGNGVLPRSVIADVHIKRVDIGGGSRLKVDDLSPERPHDLPVFVFRVDNVELRIRPPEEFTLQVRLGKG